MIDWYAYTLDIPRYEENSHFMHWLQVVEGHIPDYIGGENSGWTAKRAGWTAGRNIGNHTFIWIRRDGLMLIEHTGKGCQHLRNEHRLMHLLNETSERCTRIDLAVDMHNPGMAIEPKDFADNRGMKRTSAGGTQESKTGQTVYIGSRKSERYCRVYQYTEPHPRSDYMRIEYVMKKEYARRTAQEILLNGVHAVEKGMAAFYEWQHDLYDWSNHENLASVAVPSAHVDRDKEKTLRWLYGTVTQSVMKMAREGNLDIEDFIRHLRESAQADIPF